MNGEEVFCSSVTKQDTSTVLSICKHVSTCWIPHGKSVDILIITKITVTSTQTQYNLEMVANLKKNLFYFLLQMISPTASLILY